MGEQVVFFIVYIAEALIAAQYFSLIARDDTGEKNVLVELSIGYFILFLISKLGRPWLNSLCFLIVNILCLLHSLHMDLKKSIFHSLILTVVMNVTELMMMNILAWIYGDFSLYQDNLAVFTLLAITSKLLYFSVLQLIPRFMNIEREDMADSGKTPLLLSVIPIVSLWVAVSFILVGIEGYIPTDLNGIVAIGGILILLMNIVIFYIYNDMRKMNRAYLYSQLEIQKESSDAKYYKALTEHDESQKILIHDIKKHLYTISDLLKNSEESAAKEYVSNLVESKDLNDEVYICDHATLNLLLARYKEMCKNEGIQFFVDIRRNTVSFFNPEDITALFGNLIENAFTASKGVENAYVELMVKKMESGNILISMINSCTQKPRMASDGQLLSEKKDFRKHGLGLKSVTRIVKKYDGIMEYYYREDDKTFHTMIEISQ